MAADADVVIIGAGAAGIAAARRLAASHLSAIVLEATARVGGRAWTCDIAGMRLRSGLRMAPFRRPQPMDPHCRGGRLCGRSSRSCLGPAVSGHRLLANGPGRSEGRLRCLGAADGVHAASERLRRGRAGAGRRVERLSSGDKRLQARRWIGADLGRRLYCLSRCFHRLQLADPSWAALSLRNRAPIEISRQMPQPQSARSGGPEIPMTLAFLQSPIRFASGLFAYALLATLIGPAHAETTTRLDAIVGDWHSSRRPDRGLPAVLVR